MDLLDENDNGDETNLYGCENNNCISSGGGVSNNNIQQTETETKSKKKKGKLESIEKIFKKMGKKSTNINFDTIKFNDDALNLACLLNILDGLIELHGVMVIFTTNHPKKLDEAFLRPGRIDFKQEFKKANIETIKSIVESKFKLKFNDNFIFPEEKFHNYILSPAEIQSICFKNDEINACINELVLEHENKISNKNIK